MPDPANGNMTFVNVLADATTRIADLKFDATHLKDGLLNNISSNGQASIELNLITDLNTGGSISGSVILWKIDFVYTTTGIQ